MRVPQARYTHVIVSFEFFVQLRSFPVPYKQLAVRVARYQVTATKEQYR